jgi:Rrf2 family transcriptional repressor of oqxAB
MTDLRFATALQMVLCLAVAQERAARCTSDELAAGLGANPALVRKLLVPLVRDGVVASTVGKKGGVRLARAADKITLCDIYLAVVDNKKLLVPRNNVPNRCVVSGNIEVFFGLLAEDSEQAVLDVLADRTVADSLAELRRMQAHVDHADTIA